LDNKKALKRAWFGNSPGPYSRGWFLATPTVRVRYTVERYGKIVFTVISEDFKVGASVRIFLRKSKDFVFMLKMGFLGV